MKLRIRDLLEEYKTMDTSYKRWKLPLHRPRDSRNQLKRVYSNDKLTFSMDSFEEYYWYTYYLASLVIGVDAPTEMAISPMVFVLDV